MTPPTDPPDLPDAEDDLAPVDTRIAGLLADLEPVSPAVIDTHIAAAMATFDEFHGLDQTHVRPRTAPRRWLQAAAAIVMVVAGVSAVIAGSSSSKDATVASGAIQNKMLAPTAAQDEAGRTASPDSNADSSAGGASDSSANQYSSADEVPAAAGESKSASGSAPQSAVTDTVVPMLGSFGTVDQLLGAISSDQRAAAVVPSPPTSCSSTRAPTDLTVGVATVGDDPVTVYLTPSDALITVLRTADCAPLS